jgi:hypothetical protein
MAPIIPVRVPAGLPVVLASEQRFPADRGHPLDAEPCPACGAPLGEAVTVLVFVGIQPDLRQPRGWVSGSAIPAHADCAGVSEFEPPTREDHPLRFGAWRQAPDCGRCNDRGRFTEGGTEAHCTCKRGRRMSEMWYASKHGYGHPDEPEPDPGDYEDGAPF